MGYPGARLPDYYNVVDLGGKFYLEYYRQNISPAGGVIELTPDQYERLEGFRLRQEAERGSYFNDFVGEIRNIKEDLHKGTSEEVILRAEIEELKEALYGISFKSHLQGQAESGVDPYFSLAQEIARSLTITEGEDK